jgi:hypothetical protein
MCKMKIWKQILEGESNKSVLSGETAQEKVSPITGSSPVIIKILS